MRMMEESAGCRTGEGTKMCVQEEEEKTEKERKREKRKAIEF